MSSSLSRWNQFRLPRWIGRGWSGSVNLFGAAFFLPPPNIRWREIRYNLRHDFDKRTNENLNRWKGTYLHGLRFCSGKNSPNFRTRLSTLDSRGFPHESTFHCRPCRWKYKFVPIKMELLSQVKNKLSGLTSMVSNASHDTNKCHIWL